MDPYTYCRVFKASFIVEHLYSACCDALLVVAAAADPGEEADAQ